MPDRWIVVVEGRGGSPVRVPITVTAQDFAVGLSPNDPGTIASDSITLSSDAAWLADFGVACTAGMAARVPLQGAGAAPYDVYVFGVRDKDPASEATALSELLDAHHYTDGIGLLAPGTPTSFAGDEAPPWSSQRATADDTFSLEVGPPNAGSGSSGAAIAGVLGISTRIFDHVDASEPLAWGAREAAASAMQTALWPATLGYFLEQMLDGTQLEPATIERVRQLYVHWVRNAGPAPTLRIGRTPYGVLPISPFARWKAAGDEPLVAVISALRASWEAAVTSVPRITPGTDESTLGEVLAMEPVSREYVGRSVVGAAYATYLFDFVQHPLSAAWWNVHDARARAGWLAGGLTGVDNRLSCAVYADSHFRITSPVVQEATDDQPPLPPNYIAQLAAMSLDELRAQSELPPRTPLLYRMLRHGILAAYLGAARRASTQHLVEPEIISATTHIASPWTWIDATMRAKLEAARASGTGDPAFTSVWPALATLSGTSTRMLDELVREALDLCSHRLDAWITGLARERLATMRQTTATGVQIGAYGFVTDVAPAAKRPVSPLPDNEGAPLYAATAPGGLIRAPSLDHATTAALLRSGFLAHGGTASSSFAVDLSSDRMRTAMELLDSVRAGDSLGAVLGRCIERALVESTTTDLWSLLLPLRELVAGAVPFPDRVPIDGYALAKLARNGMPWGQHGIPAAGSPLAVALGAILAANEDALDAIADVLLAESVHQFARGNPQRAAATLDSLAVGNPPPPELEVLAPPVRGIGLRHTVAVLVPATAHAQGWAATVRASADPALEAWCAAMLGPASQYRVTVHLGDGASRVVGFDEMALSALDLVRLASTGELAAWLIDRVGGRTGASVDPARIGDARSFDDAMLLGTALAATLAHARAAIAADFRGPEVDATTATDLETRGSDTVLGDALGLLASDPASGLRVAASLGVAGAVPDRDSTRLPAQVAQVSASLTARSATLASLPAASTVPERVERARTRLRLLYGGDLVVAARFALADPALAASLADRASLVTEPEAPVTWLTQLASARAAAAPLERTMLIADALGTSPCRLEVAQLPHSQGEPWIGGVVFATDTPPTARDSFVVHAPLGLDLSQPVTGIVVDTWAETIPSRSRTTSVAFQLDMPTASPPQTMLLAVPPDPAVPWSDAVIEETVREALSLARLRLVDGDLIGSAGHFLPALYFAINLAGDTASTDFTGGS